MADPVERLRQEQLQAIRYARQQSSISSRDSWPTDNAKQAPDFDQSLPSVTSTSCESTSSQCSVFCDTDYLVVPCKPTPPPSSMPEGSPTEVEISPGLALHLRGSQETLRAIELGFLAKSTCDCCSMELYCVRDAGFVLCPECRVVHPISGRVEGGLGLGIGYKDLRQELRHLGYTR
jgi:hypothetical protein